MIPDHGNRPIRAINCGREQSPGHPALSGYLVVPSVRLELTLILDNPARLPIPPRGVYAVICLAGVSLPAVDN